MAERKYPYIDERGRAVCDPTPVEVPIRFRGLTDNLRDQVRRLVAEEMSRQAVAAGAESFDEADDFNVSDEDEYISPYELTEMQEEVLYEPEQAPAAEAQVKEKVVKGGDEEGEVSKASA